MPSDIQKNFKETKVHILKANHGDSLVIKTYDANNKDFTILIDGGPPETFRTTLVRELPNFKKIDLIILTHIDSDHIGGLLHYLQSSYAKDNIFDKMVVNAPNLAKITNGTQVSYSDGVNLEKLLVSKYPYLKILTNIVSDNSQELNLPKGVQIKILSPNQKTLDLLQSNWPKIKLSPSKSTQISTLTYAKDFNVSFSELASRSHSKKTIKNDVFNASSIAFSLETPDFHGLFLGDAHPEVIADSILNQYKEPYPIHFDYVKVSHHGSRFNISQELLNYIKCHNFIISTNGGHGRARHPDRETIAKLVKHKNQEGLKVNLFFNYSLSEIEKRTGKLFSDEEMNLFSYHHRNLLP